MHRLLPIGLLLWIAGGLSAAEPTGKRFAGEKAGRVWDGNDLKMKFCWCPPGKFMMGSPKGEPNRLDNEAQVEVTLSRGFWLGKFETTQGEWKKMTGTTLEQQRDKANPKSELRGEGENFPMHYVTYDDAMAFCAKLTEQERRAGRLPADWEMTLPTEAQWEYACRAGTTTATAFGDKLSSRQANFRGDVPYNGADKGPYLGRTAILGDYDANAWGLYDMHGNVWEWCRDWYQDKLPGGTDPEVTKRASDRVHRGGSWFVLGWHCRSAYRGTHPPGSRFHDFGFRVAAVQMTK